MKFFFHYLPQLKDLFIDFIQNFISLNNYCNLAALKHKVLNPIIYEGSKENSKS